MEHALTDKTTVNPVDRTADGTAYEEPQGTSELAIAALWREVFGLEQIGRNDNFFELGGDSVLGMQLTEMMAERLAIELPVVTLFLNPTIREVAEVGGSVALP